MIEESFVHIPLIGEKRERILWEHGIRSWYDVCAETVLPLGFPSDAVTSLLEGAKESIANFKSKNYSYFAKRFLPEDLFRIYPALADRAVFLDIETNGLHQGVNNITLIGCYMNNEQKVFIKDRNLNEFIAYIRNAQLLVTFNGKMFDIPFIEKSFNVKIRAPHIDLRFELKRLGYVGGLKKIEKALGVERPSGVDELDGYGAVLLWQRYQRFKDEDALKTLIYYNLEDTVNLEYLMRFVYNARVKELGFERAAIALKPAPKIAGAYSERVTQSILSHPYYVHKREKTVTETKE